VVSFPQVSPPKPRMNLSSPPYVLHALSISVILIWSPERHLVRSTELKAPRSTVFSIPFLPRPSQAQISSWAPCSRKLYVCIFET
jgi:hypothetical protein